MLCGEMRGKMAEKRKRIIKGFCLAAALLAVFLLWYADRGGEGGRTLSSVPALPEAEYQELMDTRQRLSGEKGLTLTVAYERQPLPFDADFGTFMRFPEIKDRKLVCETQEGVRLARTQDGEHLLAYTDGGYTEYAFWQAVTPVLVIDTGGKEIGNEAYEDVSMILFDSGSEYGFITRLEAGIHTRGASSQWIPKKSYRVKIKSSDNFTGKTYPLLGMRPAREWVLYSYYGDESKMREKLGRDLWDAIAASSSYAEAGTGLEMEYCEVYLDDEYVGVYGLGTAVDRKNYWPDKDKDRQDLLFKAVNFDAPTLSDIESVGKDEQCGALELKYASWKSGDMWDNIGMYMHLAYYASDEEYLSHMKDYMEVDNNIDYWLFLLAAGLDDNELKNIYFSIGDNQNNTRVLMTPWDLDMSWGVGYTGEDIFMWGRNDNQYKKIMEFPIVDRMFDLGDVEFTALAQKRWRELRKDVITEENVLANIRSNYDLIWNSPVIGREMAKWPEAKYAPDVEYIENYVKKRFVYLDGYMDQLGGEWDDGWD